MAQELDGIDKALLNDFQRGFPLCPRPYAVIAEKLGVSEDNVIERLARLNKAGYVARVGAAIKPNTVGAGTLAALAAPPERMDEVAALVSAQRGVNHNYARDHRLNLWFVVTGPDRAAVDQTLAAIEAVTGLKPHSFPLVIGYHIDLGFPLWTQ